MHLSTILKTREYFAEIYEDCARQAKAGVFFVNDVESYVKDCLNKKEAI